VGRGRKFSWLASIGGIAAALLASACRQGPPERGGQGDIAARTASAVVRQREPRLPSDPEALDALVARRVREFDEAQSRASDGADARDSGRSSVEAEGPIERFLAGRLLERQGWEREAEEEYRRALVLEPRFHPAHEALAARAERRGDTQGAIAELEAALAIWPENDRARVSLVRILFAAGMRDRAIQEAAAVRAGGPLAERAALLRGQALGELGRFEEAEAVLDEAAGRADDPAESWYILAGIRRARGDLEGAAALYRRIMEVRPDETQAMYLLGKTLLDLGRSREAAVVFERLAEALPEGSATDREELRRLVASLVEESEDLSPEMREVRNLMGQASGAEDPAVRLAAIREISRRVAAGSRGVLPFYRAALRDPDPSVRIVAIRELAQRAGAEALPDLVRVLDEPAENPPEVRAMACHEIAAVAPSGDRSAVPALLANLATEDGYLFGQAQRALSRVTGVTIWRGLAEEPPREAWAGIVRAWERWWSEEQARSRAGAANADN